MKKITRIMFDIKPKSKILIEKLDKILSLKYFFPLLALGFAILLYVYFPTELIVPRDILFSGGRGEALIYGLKSNGVTWGMPLCSLIIAFLKYHLNVPLEVSLKLFSCVLIFLSGLLAWGSGLILGGRRVAFFSFLVLVFFNFNLDVFDLEQIVYSFSLMLALYAIILRNKKYNLKTGILAGLAIGFTYLIRSPLFLLPFLLIFMDYFKYSKNLKKYIINSVVFLSAAYVLLLPWVNINHLLFNKFILFEGDRATSNIITSVMGTTFTMEGDARKLAGINKRESVYKWAAAKLLKNPIPFLTAVPRRLLQVIYMYPILIFLTLFVLIKRKSEEIVLVSIFTGYFIVIHCLLTIEERYFYPLKCILSVPTGFFAASFLKSLKGDKFNQSQAVKIPFIFALILILITEFLLIAYPLRAKSLSDILDNNKFNGRWLLKEKGEILLNGNQTKKGIKFMEMAYKKAPGREEKLGYILKTLKAKKISEIDNVPPNSSFRVMLVIKMLKELHMDELNAAKEDFILISDNWDKNGLRNPISTIDFQIHKEIEKTNQQCRQHYINKGLQWWPVSERLKIILNLEKLDPLSIHVKKEIVLILYQMGEYKRALVSANKLIAEKGDAPEFYNIRGVIFRVLGENAKAERDFENAVKFSPLNYEFLFNLANSKAALGKSVEAGQLLSKILSSEEGFKWVDETPMGIKNQYFLKLNWNNSIKFYLKKSLEYSKAFRASDFPEPLHSIAEVLDSDNSSLNYFHVSRGNISTGEFLSLARLYGSIGNNRQFKLRSRKLFDSHLENPIYAIIYLSVLRPKDFQKEMTRILKRPEYVILPIEYFLNKGNAEDKLIVLLPLFLKQKDLNDEGFQRLALIYQSMDKYEKALKILNKLILKKSQNVSLYNARGVLFRFLNENAKAEKDFEKGVSLEPSNYEVLFNLAGAKSALGKKADAEALFSEIVKSSPKSKWADISRKEIKNLYQN